MALRRQDLQTPDPWVRVADVLAEAAGVDGGRGFDEAAEQAATGMRGVRRDWAGKPCLRESAARELLGSLRADQRRRVERTAALVAQVEADRADMVPAGVVQVEAPGHPTWVAPWYARNPHLPDQLGGR